MKILFISDTHGIPQNLAYIDELMDKENFDKLVCLGDLYYASLRDKVKYKANSLDVYKFLKKHSDKLICMRGNCDSFADLKSSDFPICEGLSLISTDGLDIYLTHGHEYSHANGNFNRKGVLVYGHEHIPYITKSGDMVYICVGSISLPRNGIATYAVYENNTFTIYDINNQVIDSTIV